MNLEDKKMKFSTLILINNESINLKKTLYSIINIKSDEYVFILDRCIDDSENIILGFFNKYYMINKVKIIYVNKKNNDFVFQPSYLRVLGCNNCSYKYVLFVDADIIIDYNIISKFKFIKKYKFISFEHIDYPVNFRQMLKRFFSFLPFSWLGGVKLFDKDILLKNENVSELKKLESQDTHILKTFKDNGYNGKYFLSNCIHLRPNENKERHFKRGVLYSKYNRSFVITVFSSVLLFRFSLIKGFIKHRYGKKFK